MRPIKNPAATLRRSRVLVTGEVIAAGDYVVLHGKTYQLTTGDRWIGDVIEDGGAAEVRRVEKPDPLEVETRRAIARTSRGKLERLLVERSAARRRVTMALTRLDVIDREIATLSRAMAEARFNADLAAL